MIVPYSQLSREHRYQPRFPRQNWKSETVRSWDSERVAARIILKLLIGVSPYLDGIHELQSVLFLELPLLLVNQIRDAFERTCRLFYEIYRLFERACGLAIPFDLFRSVLCC